MPHTDTDLPELTPGRSWFRRLRVPLAATAALIAAGTVLAVVPSASASLPFTVESLDGGGNNVNNPTWGQSNQPYARVGTAHYADGVGTPVNGPNARAASNRIISDIHQNIFSERRVTQWGWAWGQFLDHTFGLRADSGATATAFNIPFNAADPQEAFSSNLGVIPVNRSAAAPGTGTSTANPRQQTNTLPSYIGGNPVYGATAARLDWLRDGSNDGNPTNNQATLMLPNGYLPNKSARGNPATAPAVDINGRLAANPNNAAEAGDFRVNENIGLTATHTLFAREHNRIVGLLPNTLSQEDKFQIARRVVIAEEQYITYQEFLPAMGVALPRYTGYKTNINTNLSNEFATVGYRAHSQIHGEIEIEQPLGTYTAAQLSSFVAQGLEVENPSPENSSEVAIAVPLNVMFFNPELLKQLGEGPVLQALGAESQYNNDEQIDDALRSILFDVPVSSNPDCLDGPTQPTCFNVVNDLGAIDIQRGRDHGTGTYNQIRAAYGLPAVTSFTQITGEATDAFPPGLSADTKASLDFTQLFDIDGKAINLNDEDAVANTATRGVRRTTLAARLKAVYGNLNNIDGFVGIIAEKHVPGTDFGETQLAVWTREFQRLRDGDRFFYGNDQGLSYIKSTYGIDYRHTLADIIKANTTVDPDEINPNVFTTADENLPATTCSVQYTVTTTWPGHFQVNMKISNTSTTPINGWTLKFNFYNGQSVYDGWGGTYSATGPNGRDVTVVNASFDGSIPAGGSMDGIGFNALADDFANAHPPNMYVNGRRCAVPLS
jgi:hypothetical protein